MNFTDVQLDKLERYVRFTMTNKWALEHVRPNPLNDDVLKLIADLREARDEAGYREFINNAIVFSVEAE